VFLAILRDQRPSGPQPGGEVAGSVAGHRQAGAVPRAIGSEAADDGDGARGGGRRQRAPVTLLVGFGGEEVEGGGWVAILELFAKAAQ
jgi:hypothetical protein